MKRNPESMAEKEYDLLVVGGGITGICIARDAALRGLSVALVDKGDFGAATTAASSKLIHGGLRYLQNLELGLVRESLRERRIWSNIAPHMVHPLMFLMPLHDKRIRGRLKVALGLTAYDLLAYDRNRLDDPAKAVPAHRSLSREEAIALEPGLASDTLTGAIIFYDYQMHCPERLALACLRSAVDIGADVANYMEAREFLIQDKKVMGVRARDNLRARPHLNIHAKLTINAAGPWADILTANLSSAKRAQRLIRSKGIHILTRPLTQGRAVAAQTAQGHFFVLPWRGYSLIGTTDTVYRGDPDAFRVTERDIRELLNAINMAYPAARVQRSDVLYFYGGLRPIVDPSNAVTDAQDSYTASRAAEIMDHETEDDVSGILTAIGGKWTTARSLAEQVVDMALVKLSLPPVACRAAETPVYGGDTGPFSEFLNEAKALHPELPGDTVEHLACHYGTALEALLRPGLHNPSLRQRLDSRLPEIAAQVDYAIDQEMAMTAEDILLRRTGLGTLGRPAENVVETVLGRLASTLEYDRKEMKSQRERFYARYLPAARIRAIVNPRSSGSYTARRWPEIAEQLAAKAGPFDTVFTDGPMAACRLTTDALNDGVEQIIAVGGDGTLNEVVNGFFVKDRPVNPQAVLSVICSGTGADFRKTLNIPKDLADQARRIAEGEARAIDLGKVTYRDDATAAVKTRYFDNVASFGLSGAADRTVNQQLFAKRLGGKFAFQWGTLMALLRYQGARIRLQVDDTFDDELDINTVAVCNGRYFGGGMCIAPDAEPDDGLFDVIVVRKAPVVRILTGLPSLYTGAHLKKAKHVFQLRGRRVIAEPANLNTEVLIDVDGEAPGRLPATFEIVPRAILIKA